MSDALMRKGLYIIVFLCACGLAHAAPTQDLVIDMVAPPPQVELGFGWLGPERNESFSFVWMSHLEADIWVTLDSTAAADIEITAVPYYLNYRSQSLGLYVNGRFVREWVCPIHSEWRLDTYTADVPAGTVKAGRNRITLRASYRIAEGKRQHAIAVNRLSLKWK